MTPKAKIEFVEFEKLGKEKFEIKIFPDSSKHTLYLKYGVLYFDPAQKKWFVKVGRGASDSRLGLFAPSGTPKEGLLVAGADEKEEDVKRAEALAVSDWWLDQEAEYGEGWWKK